MIIPTWVLPFVAYCTVIVGWSHFHKHSRPSTECYVPFLTESPIFTTVSTVVVYWIPTAIIWSIYAYIYRIVKQMNKRYERGNRRRDGSEKKARKTLALILSVFFLTWSPYSLVVIIMAYFPENIPVTLYHFCYYLCYVNSTLNPLCYALSNDRFKRAFRTILCNRKIQTTNS